MSASQGISAAAVRAPLHQHPRAGEESCPLCDQPIPPEKYEEIHGRIQAKERERGLDVERRLKEHAALERVHAETKAKAEIEQARKEASATIEKVTQDAVAREAVAREEARKLAETAAAGKIAEIEKAKKAAEEQAKEQWEAFEKIKQEAPAKEAAAREEARKTAETAAAARIAEAEQAKKVAEQHAKERLETLERIKQEAVVKEAVVRDEARKAAEAAAATKVAEAEQARKAAEQQAKERLEMLERTKQEAVVREATAREEARKAVEANYGPKLAEAEQGKKTAEQQLQATKADQENALALRLKEQREALEKSNAEALNAERAKAFNDKLKVEEKLQAATRQLQQKTAEELGEGAEVDLFEALRAEFVTDQISRIDKGVAGPDIVHHVVHNNKICGSIIYDSKNRSAWRYDYATKLRQEQLAINADHAILSTNVFPANTRQIHIHDGVLIANPARVVVLVELLRRQIVHNYSLRLGNEAREQKTNQLYEFVTSDKAAQLLEHIEARAEDLLDLDVKEQKAHAAIWKSRGQLVRAVQRSRADFVSQIERIVGTETDGDPA